MNKRIFLVSGILVACWILLSVGLGFGKQLVQPANTSNGWTAVFTETFTNTLSLWTFTETTTTGYQWGVIPYTKMVGSTKVNDFGLWATGGGTEGEQLVWPSDTYTNNMNTIAVAGPITLAQGTTDVRLSIDVVNNIDPSDVFSVGLSLDGSHFIDAEVVTTEPLSWQSVEWISSAANGADKVWILFQFASDAAGVNTGPSPLVDNISLAVQSESSIYLPFIIIDPTPTPTPTPTPIPDYRDDFDNPTSGWYIGPAMRLNRRYLNGEWVYVWEAVNWLDYLDGHYQMYIPLTAHGGGDVDTWFVRTVEYAPMPQEMSPLPQNYCVEVSAYMAGDYDPDYLLAHWGVVFGGDAAKTKVYTFQINSLGRFHILLYDNYVYPGRRVDPHFPGENIEIKLYNVGSEFEWGNPHIPLNSSHYHNTLKAAVKGDQLNVYINGQCVLDGYGNCLTANIPGMPRDRVGLLGCSWEPTPVDIRFDYFRYDPFCPEVQ
jgi:hypothetical protein